MAGGVEWTKLVRIGMGIYEKKIYPKKKRHILSPVTA
jgi:hypothetical protein